MLRVAYCVLQSDGYASVCNTQYATRSTSVLLRRLQLGHELIQALLDPLAHLRAHFRERIRVGIQRIVLVRIGHLARVEAAASAGTARPRATRTATARTSPAAESTSASSELRSRRDLLELLCT